MFKRIGGSNKCSENVKSDESMGLSITGNSEGTITNDFIRERNSNGLFQQQRCSLTQKYS